MSSNGGSSSGGSGSGGSNRGSSVRGIEAVLSSLLQGYNMDMDMDVDNEPADHPPSSMFAMHDLTEGEAERLARHEADMVADVSHGHSPSHRR